MCSSDLLVDAPKDIEGTLGPLPANAVLRRNPRCVRNVTLSFLTSRRELERRVAAMARFGEGGGLWLIWPKQASALKTDLTQAVVRRIGLAAGLVYYKICAVDATWSGLKFSLRKPARVSPLRARP